MKKNKLVIFIMLLILSITACTKFIETEKNTEPVLKTASGDVIEFISNDYKPVIISFKDREGRFSKADVLGGYKDGKWYTINDFTIKGRLTEPEQFFVPKGMTIQEFEKIVHENFVEIDLLKGDETFKMYSGGKYITTEKGTKPVLTINNYTIEKILTINILPFRDDDNFVVGLNGDWNAFLRTPKEMKEKNTYSIDMDNDGVNEILSIKEVANEISVSVNVGGRDIPVRKITIDGIDVREYDVLTIDLNGDEKLELLIAEDGHNRRVSAYELNDGNIEEILHYYYGD